MTRLRRRRPLLPTRGIHSVYAAAEMERKAREFRADYERTGHEHWRRLAERFEKRLADGGVR